MVREVTRTCELDDQFRVIAIPFYDQVSILGFRLFLSTTFTQMVKPKTHQPYQQPLTYTQNDSYYIKGKCRPFIKR
ncbi:hypothetical protein O9992_15480 [Vibrio lentus]|nr:hypothetical protein [Vibrio lentus]